MMLKENEEDRRGAGDMLRMFEKMAMRNEELF
jgi:hypothetical protein